MSRVGLVVIASTTALTAVVFTRHPELDLAISAAFFDPARGIFPAQNDRFLAGFRFVTSWAVAIGIAVPAIALIGKMLFPSRPALLPGRAMLLILVTIAVGPGLLVNAGLKENWNRPRPGAVQEFGGAMAFSRGGMRAGNAAGIARSCRARVRQPSPCWRRPHWCPRHGR